MLLDLYYLSIHTVIEKSSWKKMKEKNNKIHDNE
jgi:hypothetical protein